MFAIRFFALSFATLMALLTIVAAQETDLREQVLRDEGLDWLLPFVVCPRELLPDTLTEFDYDRRVCENHLTKCVENCRGGDGGQCFIAALTHQQLENDAHADGLFQQACEKGMAAGCTNIAASLRVNNGGDQKCVADTFVAACRGGDAWGCTMSGLVYWDGEGVAVDRKKAKSYFDQSCSIDADFEACNYGKSIIAEDSEGDE